MYVHICICIKCNKNIEPHLLTAMYIVTVVRLVSKLYCTVNKSRGFQLYTIYAAAQVHMYSMYRTVFVLRTQIF
jgi:hypothetical protein